MTTVRDSESLAEGQQVISATAMLTADFDGVTKVFLAKRSDDRKFLPGVYEMPGGHIDYGENIKVGLAREIREELSVEITIGDAFAAFTYVNQIKKSHSVEVVFFAQFVGPLDAITLDPANHSAADWFSLEDLHMAYGGNKNSDDEEFLAIRRGFALLGGASHDRG